jgi:hypothetical protein
MKEEKHLLEQLSLGIAANGGKEFRENDCHCDPAQGYVLCEYCAIYKALKNAKEYVISKVPAPVLLELKRAKYKHLLPLLKRLKRKTKGMSDFERNFIVGIETDIDRGKVTGAQEAKLEQIFDCYCG